MSDNPIFSYTRRDYEGSRKEGLSRIPILSKGKWTDLNATDPGIIILDYVHALADMINYYQDHQALESFLVTAKERANIFRLAKQLSYKVKSAKGAMCDVTFAPNTQTYNYTIRIPKNTEVSTADNISYITLEDSYLLANQTSVDILCTQGKLMKINYQGTGISRYSNVLGAQNQSVRIVDENIDIDSIHIVDKSGNEWKPVDYIVFSKENEKVYEVDINPDNTIFIRFGDGNRGAVPSTEDNLEISYLSTLAENGNIGKNAIVYLKTPIYNDSQQYIDFSVNNKNESYGGYSVQSSQDIKDYAPGSVKAQDRAVMLEDYENLARAIPGVKDAIAYDINKSPDLCLFYEVKVLIVPEDGVDSKILNSNVRKSLIKKCIPPTNLYILSPTHVTVDIEVKYRKLDNLAQGRVDYAVEKAIREYFDNRSSAVGKSFEPSELRTILSRLEEIRSIDSVVVTAIDPNTEGLRLPTSNDIFVSELSIIKLGNIKLN